jgi:hypothetical protein
MYNFNCYKTYLHFNKSSECIIFDILIGGCANQFEIDRDLY